MTTYFKSAIRRLISPRFFENVNHTRYNRHCLLLYITAPFRKNSIDTSHTNQWQVLELAAITGEFGYNVDVMDFDYTMVQFNKHYDLIIDLHPGLNNSYQNFISENALKVAYVTGSNPAFSNQAECERIEKIYQQRGVKLTPRRYVKPFGDEFESCDAMFFIGNAYNLKTFSDFTIKKLFFIKNAVREIHPNPDFFKKSPQNFLFLGGSGQVLKGLDLLLDVFSANNHINLYVCSYFKTEEDFCNLYKKELFHTDNIFPIGRIDTSSHKFLEICQKCSYVVLPSASEGISGSILTGMAYGLVPVASRECGLESDEVHFFESASVKDITSSINELADQTPEWIRSESLKAIDIINHRYNKGCFSKSVKDAMQGLLL